jgi:signal transduction histidine kinase
MTYRPLPDAGASRPLAPSARAFALGIALRTLIIAALAALALRLLLTTHLFATALVIIGVAALVGADLMKAVGRLDRYTGASRPAGDSHEVTDWPQQVEYRQTLLDTVAAALFVVEDGGRVTLANRAARRLASREVYRLADVAAIGAAGAERLLALAPGTRQIVTLAEGRRLFVSVAQFSAPSQLPRRLIALQRIAGELDAVEVQGWQDVAQVLAHEMMNSLTPIASLSESLEALLQQRQQGQPHPSQSPTQLERSSSASAEISGALEAIRRRSRGLMEFVERYRLLAQLPTPELQPVRLGDFLSGIERLMAGTFREHGVSYQSRVVPADLSCRADARLLEQAVINLLRNALEATAGAPEARIGIACEQRDGRIFLTVADSGRGIAPGDQDRIFMPFYSTKSGGSGIGLTLARQVALAHGGQLEVSAQHPRGTTFELMLPGAAGNSAPGVIKRQPLESVVEKPP